MTGILRVDTIQNSNTSTIITQTNATTITLGFSGSTIAIASGATQTGFGRTGAVNWDTTPKTTTVTAVSGVGYFVDTTTTTLTVNLPVGVAGDIVAISDYANTSATNKITIDPNGTDKINGLNQNAEITTNGASVTLIYIDSTRGWKDVNDATLNVTGINPFVVATGGTILTCGDFKTHVFTGPGTFTVTSAGTPAGSNSVEYLVVAGGASGGKGDVGGAGGAGGYRQNYPSPVTAGLPVTAQAYPITVGAGGTAITSPNTNGNPGNNSIFSTITSTSGGGGGGPNTGGGPVTGAAGLPGGSGGGGAHGATGGAGGTGNTPPTSPSQGNNGGNGSPGPGPAYGAGGGGGAGGVGSNGTSANGGAGGVGSTIATTVFGPTSPSYGTPGPAPGRYFAGGGGGGRDDGGTGGAGGSGGGGAGGSSNQNGVNGTANTGGGGGGTGDQSTSGGGGSGIVVIRYKFQ
jgi:hypothetical protein